LGFPRNVPQYPEPPPIFPHVWMPRRPESTARPPRKEFLPPQVLLRSEDYDPKKRSDKNTAIPPKRQHIEAKPKGKQHSAISVPFSTFSYENTISQSKSDILRTISILHLFYQNSPPNAILISIYTNYFLPQLLTKSRKLDNIVLKTK